MPHVVIVGGGLTGLSVAFRLRQLAPAVSVTVLESHDRPGGNIGTEDHDGFRVEIGPNGFLDRLPFLPNLIRDLGISDRLVAASEGSRKNRYLYLHGKLRKLPRGPLGLLTTSLLSLRGKWQLLTEPWRKPPPGVHTPGSPRASRERKRPEPRKDESVAEFVTRRAGKEAADVFADALVTGIHGGDPAQLSVAATFPRLPQMEREAGSIVRGFLRAARQRKRDARARGEPPPGPQKMWSFREGLRVLPEALAESLGPALHCGVSVRQLTRAGLRWFVRAAGADSWYADAVVLACPAFEQAALLAEIDAKLADEIAAIPYNRIAVVALGYRQSDCPGAPDGFGYIAPQNTRRDVLGVQWCSSIFPDRAPPGCVLWRALCGGVHRGEMLDWDDDRLAKAVHTEIRRAMGVRGEPVFRRIVRWPRAIPQYVVGHLDRVAKIEAASERHRGLFLTGNAYHGVAMGDCAEQGELVAARVAAFAERK
jgi:oxygen-dependent protoporphyrinogen oxidase